MRVRVDPRTVSWLFLVALWLSAQIIQTAAAQSSDPIRFGRWAAGDVRAFSQSIATPKAAIIIGAVGGTVILISPLDRWLTRNSQELMLDAPRRVRKVLHEVGNVNVVRPMAAVVFLGTLTSGDAYLQNAAFTSLEAIIYANLATNVLKTVVGRARPNEGVGPASFTPFGGGRSFPSGHATTVFAFTTPWVLYYPGAVTYTLFGLGIGTAAVRMADDYHWFTDVLSGALIGAGTGYLLSRRHKQLAIVPVLSSGGTGVSVIMRL